MSCYNECIPKKQKNSNPIKEKRKINSVQIAETRKSTRASRKNYISAYALNQHFASIDTQYAPYGLTSSSTVSESITSAQRSGISVSSTMATYNTTPEEVELDL
ncbi:hypothetical protein HHI36_002301 [Cryptolaemus montrouzieri]|uniref:Uncharacterized protein n=1 Tax=Cryptolaemus montrouzieri TaxID=559131 RepID=A0ABD2PAT3_9CUCU